MVQSLNFGGITTFFKLLTRPKLFLPHLILDDIRKVDFKLLKDSGFKAVVFDKDNTLTAPYKLILHPPFLDSWLQCKTVFGPNVLVVSNSAGTPDDKTNEAFRIEKELG